MTGSQLRHWRTTHDLTLRQLAEQLAGVVHFSTITGWETAENGSKEIPEWATEKILATTQVTLPLDELHQLLDAAREDNISAQEMIGQAIHEWLQRRTQPEIQAIPITAAGHKLTLYSTDVPAPALSEPRGGVGAPNQPHSATRPDGSLQ